MDRKFITLRGWPESRLFMGFLRFLHILTIRMNRLFTSPTPTEPPPNHGVFGLGVQFSQRKMMSDSKPGALQQTVKSAMEKVRKSGSQEVSLIWFWATYHDGHLILKGKGNPAKTHLFTSGRPGFSGQFFGMKAPSQKHIALDYGWHKSWMEHETFWCPRALGVKTCVFHVILPTHQQPRQQQKKAETCERWGSWYPGTVERGVWSYDSHDASLWIFFGKCGGIAAILEA